jgi:hypothetical protein
MNIVERVTEIKERAERYCAEWCRQNVAGYVGPLSDSPEANRAFRNFVLEELAKIYAVISPTPDDLLKPPNKMSQDEAIAAIEVLRRELAAEKATSFQLSAGVCTQLIGDDHGNPTCAPREEVERLRSGLYALLKENTGLRERVPITQRPTPFVNVVRLAESIGAEPVLRPMETIRVIVPELPEVVITTSVADFLRWREKYPCLEPHTEEAQKHFYDPNSGFLEFRPKETQY